MEFKQTSDGRVFFGQAKEANDTPLTSVKDNVTKGRIAKKPQNPAKPLRQKVQATKAQGPSSMQIVGLLRSLNEKLQDSQIERRQMRAELDRYRIMVEDLQEQGATMPLPRDDGKAQEALQEIQEARRLILQIETKAERTEKGVSTLKAQLENTEKSLTARQETVEQSVAQTHQQYEQLSDQVDKVKEDRALFMRKIERIEDVVLQTQNSLNERSFQFLTDQQLRHTKIDEPLDINDVTPLKALSNDNDTIRQLVRKDTAQTIAIAMAVILFFAVAGWAGYQSYQDNATDSVIETSINAPVNTPGSSEKASVDLNNTDEVLNLLNKNPDALARQLNDIEPSIKPPTTMNGAMLQKPLRDNRLPETIAPIQDEAYNGTATAQHDLAAIYTAGHAGVGQDFTRAAYWFTQASDQGIANASYNLGVLYHQGLGVDKDIDRAIALYQKAAGDNHGEALYNLGIAHIESIGVQYNPQKAAEYFENAAAQGITEAGYNLGLIYENGLLGDVQPDQAIAWYKKASDAGNADARAALKQLADATGMNVDDIGDLMSDQRTQAAPTQQFETVLSTVSPSNTTMSVAQNPVPDPMQIVTTQIQEYLMRAGLYPGPASGDVNAMTRDAIRVYQARNGLLITGQPDESLLAGMMNDADANDYGSRE